MKTRVNTHADAAQSAVLFFSSTFHEQHEKNLTRVLTLLFRAPTQQLDQAKRLPVEAFVMLVKFAG